MDAGSARFPSEVQPHESLSFTFTDQEEQVRDMPWNPGSTTPLGKLDNLSQPVSSTAK